MNAVLKPLPRRELLIGCGHRRAKDVTFDDIPPVFTNLTTLDIDPVGGADVVHDLNILPYPFADETFDEVHAYEALEHCGRQGDAKFFFDQFTEFWRILKPGGWFCGSCPTWDGEWAWADPGHTRIITAKTLAFLDQDFYELEVGKTSASDYRPIYKANFKVMGTKDRGAQHYFVLQKK